MGRDRLGRCAVKRFLKRVLARGYRQTNVEWEFHCARPLDYDFSKNKRLE